MSVLLTIVHVIVCLVLILSILLQSGKAADLAGAFGGMGSQTGFGPRGTASLLSKITTACAILFMVTSLGLWLLSAGGGRSVLSGVKAPAPAAQKATPPATTPAPEKKEATPPAAPEKKAPETQAPAAQPDSKPAAAPEKK